MDVRIQIVAIVGAAALLLVDPRARAPAPAAGALRAAVAARRRRPARPGDLARRAGGARRRSSASPTPPNALFFIAFGFVLVLLLHFSVAVSRLTDQSKVLAQRAGAARGARRARAARRPGRGRQRRAHRARGARERALGLGIELAMRRSLRRLPAPLLVLLALCVVEALAWAVVVPPLSGPDEVSHVAYVQKIVDAHEIPWVRGESARPAVRRTRRSWATRSSSAASRRSTRTGRGDRPGRRSTRSCGAAREAGHDRADRADGGFTSALKNPPAYYLYESLPYLAASSLGIFDQVFVMRMANVPLFLIAVIFVWLTAGELLHRRRWLQVLATAAAALQPLLTHLAATVNPDVFLTAIWSVALYLMVVALKRGLTARLTGALVVLAALSSLTHGRGVALVGPVLLTIGLALWKARRPGVRPAGRSAVALAVVGVLVGTALLVAIALKGAITASGVRQFGSYLWQFYLGRADFLQPIGPDYGFRDVSVDRFFGGYAQFEIGFSPAINDALWWGMIVIAVLGVTALLKHGPLGERWDVAVVLVSLPLAALALVHATAFPIVVGSTGDPGRSPAATCYRSSRCTASRSRRRSRGCRGARGSLPEARCSRRSC